MEGDARREVSGVRGGEPGAKPYQISHLMSSQTVHTRDTDERYLKVGRTCTPNRTLEAYGDSNSTSTSVPNKTAIRSQPHLMQHFFVGFGFTDSAQSLGWSWLCQHIVGMLARSRSQCHLCLAMHLIKISQLLVPCMLRTAPD